MSNILGTWTIQPTNRCGSIWHRPWAIPTTLPSHWWFVARGFLKGEFQKISRIRERFQGHLKCVIVRSTIISEKKGSWFLPFSTPWIFRSRVGWDPMQANLMDAIRYLARCKYVSVPRGWDTRLPVKKTKTSTIFCDISIQSFPWAAHTSQWQTPVAIESLWYVTIPPVA